MRNKKGILILLTLALLCGCFTGCKKDKEDSKETTEAAQTTAVSSATLEAATPPHMLSFIRKKIMTERRTIPYQRMTNLLFRYPMYGILFTPMPSMVLWDIMHQSWRSLWTAP